MSDHPGTGRQLWAALHLLDRQLLDRHGQMAGCVDDIELSPGAEGTLYVSAILAGPGVLAPRLGAPRFGAWRRRSQQLWANDRHERDGHDRPDAEGTDPTRIPFGRVQRIASHITLAADSDELASYASERWVRDHVIGRLPGSDHAAE
jgi:hypothetical protein